MGDNYFDIVSYNGFYRIFYMEYDSYKQKYNKIFICDRETLKRANKDVENMEYFYRKGVADASY